MSSQDIEKQSPYPLYPYRYVLYGLYSMGCGLTIRSIKLFHLYNYSNKLDVCMHVYKIDDPGCMCRKCESNESSFSLLSYPVCF